MRKVLITGATSGFGKLLVDAFLKNGDYVIATGRNINSRKEIFEAERVKYAKHFLELELDVTKKDQIALGHLAYPYCLITNLRVIVVGRQALLHRQP